MAKDHFYKQLTKLVLPIMIQNFMLSLVSATDALMLGFVNQDSLSAVSLAGQVQFILSLYVSAMAIGMAIMAAQYWGKRDNASIEQVIPIALRVNLIGGILFTAAALGIPEVLMRFFTNEESLIGLGADYLRAVAPSYVLVAISQIYLTTLKNTDRVASASRISSAAVVINIALNWVLIFGVGPFPRLEIVGAAIATSAARLIETLWSWLSIRHTGSVQVRWSGMFKGKNVLAHDFWKYTWPVIGASFVWGLAFTLYNVVIGHLGTDAVAANSIASIAKSLISCLIRGISAGTGIMIGNVLGADDLPRAKEYGRRLTILAAIVGAVTGGLLMLSGPLLVHFTDLSEQASYYLRYMMIICGVNLAFQSVNMTVLDGIFCAGGDSKFDMIQNLMAMWAFGVPLSFIGAFWWKLPVLWVYLFVSLDEIVKIPFVFVHYKKYVWLKNITRQSA